MTKAFLPLSRPDAASAKRHGIAPWGRLALLGAALALGACSDMTNAAPQFRTSMEPPTNTVERLAWPHGISFTAKQSSLNASQRTALAQAIQAAGGPDAVHVIVASPTDAKGASSKLTATRQDSITKALLSMGMSGSHIEVSKEPSRTPGAFALSIERYVVTPPNCPDWSEALGSSDARQIGSNWGCASATNLGLMVADPRDLVVGKATAPADATHEANSVERYRTDKVYPPSEAGTGSDAGGN
jgi:pilus assembly protein CpaD